MTLTPRRSDNDPRREYWELVDETGAVVAEGMTEDVARALANPWRPIETAPKDDHCQDVLLARFDEDGSEWRAVGQWFVNAWAFMYAKDSKYPVLLCFEPTHWQPLP